MDNSKKKRMRARKSRVMRVRKKVRGTDIKPRLTVFKSNTHIYAQLIDDIHGITLCGMGTMSKSIRGDKKPMKSKEMARLVGTEIAKEAKKKQIGMAIFDRGRYKFHGLIAELANAAREAGLQF